MAVDDKASAKPSTSAEDWWLPQDQGQGAKRGGGAEDLQGAEPEDEPADNRQTLPRQFKADHEQEKDDAEFRDRRDLLDIVESERSEPADLPRERAKAIGTEQYPRAKESQNRTDLQAPEQWHDHARRREKNQGFLVLLRREGAHEFPDSMAK